MTGYQVKSPKLVPNPKSYMVTTPTGVTYRHNRRQLKSLDYTSVHIPRPTTGKKCSTLCSGVTQTHDAMPKKKVVFNLSSTITPKWYSLDSEILSEEIPNPYVEPLPTAVEVPHAQQAEHLTTTPSLLTFYLLPAKPPRQLPVFFPEAFSIELKI